MDIYFPVQEHYPRLIEDIVERSHVGREGPCVFLQLRFGEIDVRTFLDKRDNALASHPMLMADNAGVGNFVGQECDVILDVAREYLITGRFQYPLGAT